MQLTKKEKIELESMIGVVYANVAINISKHFAPFSDDETIILEGLRGNLTELRHFLGLTK